MRHALVLGLVVLVACQPIPKFTPVAPEKVVVPKVVFVPAPPHVDIPLDPIAAVAVLPPKQLKVAASRTLTDADHYVAWKMSRRENIEMLTQLTQQLTDSLAAMIDSNNNKADVARARKALKALRVFLVTKGD